MGNTINAMFRCTSVTRHEAANPHETVILVAAGKDGTNTDWSKWTPTGRIEMTITSEGAIGRFTPGKHYALTFTEQD